MQAPVGAAVGIGDSDARPLIIPACFCAARRVSLRGAELLMPSLVLTLTLLLTFSRTAIRQPTQHVAAPITRQEINSQLKEAEARRLSQADIAAEVERRGIAFTVDDKTLSELRRAGARSFLLDTIQRASKSAGRPQISDPEPVDDEAQRRARDGTSTLPILEQARGHAAEFAEELPNFIVTQLVSRYVRTPENKDWQLEDKLEIELTYRAGKGEEFELLRVNGKPAAQSYNDIGGSTSTGEFGSILASLFSPNSKAEFKEVKRETFHGRPTIVYDFKVKKANSRSAISDLKSKKSVVAGYSGTVWIDTETARALRIEESHDDIPAGFPVSLSENAVEYDWITIGGERYLLPVRAEVLLGMNDQKVYTRNVIEFSGYRKFEAKIKVDPN